eukprot:1969947-Pleurochrysis_carterae.AAC.1
MELQTCATFRLQRSEHRLINTGKAAKSAAASSATALCHHSYEGDGHDNLAMLSVVERRDDVLCLPLDDFETNIPVLEAIAKSYLMLIATVLIHECMDDLGRGLGSV